MGARELFFPERAKHTAEQAKSAEAMGLPKIAEAYCQATRLWQEMAEQAKRMGD